MPRTQKYGTPFANLSHHMRKRISFLTFLAVLALFQDLLFAYEYPVPQDQDFIVLVLNRPQMASLYSRQNYIIPQSSGVCYGLDRMNQTLLTKVQFEPGEREADDQVILKLLLAFLGTPQIIFGYDSVQDFTQKMDQEWHLNTNPLKRRIEAIQLSQNLGDIANQVLCRHALIAKEGEEKVIRTEAQTFVKYILKGVPLYIGIVNPNFGPHALTVVGFKQNILAPTPFYQFYVLDSNHPHQLQILRVDEKGNWVYDTWKYLNAQIVSLIWKEPSESEIGIAQATFQPQFLLGTLGEALSKRLLDIHPSSGEIFLFPGQKTD